jgi:hypothetical protein
MKNRCQVLNLLSRRLTATIEKMNQETIQIPKEVSQQMLTKLQKLEELLTQMEQRVIDIPDDLEVRLLLYCCRHAVTPAEVMSVALLQFLDATQPEARW